MTDQNQNPFGGASYPFAVGRVKARESSLLDRGQWSRLLDGDETQALSALREYGYGGENRGDSIDTMISAELAETANFLAEITPDPQLTAQLLLPSDAHNLKVLLKARLVGEDPAPMLTEGGSIPTEVLRACVEYGDFSSLGEEMERELADVFEQTSPRLVSAAVDRAVFARAAGFFAAHKCPVLERYFAVWTRYLNLLSSQRALRLGWTGAESAAMLVPVIGEAEDLPAPKLGESLRETERNMRRALLLVLREERDDSFGIAPIANYLMEKQNEARNLRILFAAKRAGQSIEDEEFDF